MTADADRCRRWVPIVGALAATGFAAGLIAALPRFVGASWAVIWSSLSGIPVLVLVGLVILWFLGLVVHAPVLMAALPGLRARQALTLNLSGSAVSNVLPVGGPAGMGLGYAMARSWGFSADRFASYTVVTNLWNALGKFGVGLGILAVASLVGAGLPGSLVSVVLSATAIVIVAVGAAVITFRSERATLATGRRLDRIAGGLKLTTGSEVCAIWLLNSRRELHAAVRCGWKTMTAGVLFYLVLQSALLYACLSAVGGGAGIAAVAVAFAIERLISLAPITPGAAGLAELGTVAALQAFGVDPVAAAAAVLLYRILMFAVEIPIGGLLTLLWLRTGRHPAVPDGRDSADEGTTAPVSVIVALEAAA